MRTTWMVVVILAGIGMSIPAMASSDPPAVDFALAASTPPGTVDSEQPLVLTVTVTNNGAATATAEAVFDAPHESAVDMSAGTWQPSTFSGAEGGSPGVWRIEDVPPGATETLHLTYRLKRASHYEIELDASGDPDLSNNKASGPLEVRQTKSYSVMSAFVKPHLVRNPPFPPLRIKGELFLLQGQPKRARWCAGHVDVVVDASEENPQPVVLRAHPRLRLVHGHCRYHLTRRMARRRRIY
jgi:Domain of unknown function DUF11